MSNLCKGKTPIPLSIAKEIIKVTQNGFNSDDIDILSESAWICNYLTEHYSEIIDFLFEFDLISIMLIQIHNINTKMQCPVLKVFGNISASENIYCETLMSKGFISIISPLLTHPNNSIKKEVLFIFSNLFATNSELILTILYSPCMEAIIKYTSSTSFNIKKEAVWGICNAACEKDIRIISKLIEMNVLSSLIHSLCHNDADFLSIIVSAIRNIFEVLSNKLNGYQWEAFITHFEELKGFYRLHQLSEHSNKKINAEAENIISRYSKATQPRTVSFDHSIYSFA